MPLATMRDAPLGSPLLGQENEGSVVRRIRIQVLLTALIVGANVIGIAIVLVLVGYVIPGPDVLDGLDGEFFLANAILVPIYIAVALVVGIIWGTTKSLRLLKWTRDGSTPSKKEVRAALTVPMRLTVIQFFLWAVALVLFTTVYGIINPEVIAKVAFTIGFAGIVVCAIAYLLSEFALRPVAAQALAYVDKRPRWRAGTAARALVGWSVGTGVPVAGLMIIAIAAVIRDDVATHQLAIAILALGTIVIVFGGFMELLTAFRTAAPLRVVRKAMHKVERGKLDARVVVFDGTELGDLQVGFNRMAEGLREREKMRDLFGRHVGRAVAENAMSNNLGLGGEERTVAVLFVDVIGSTTLATERPPTEVVELLNRFFAVIVEEVDRNGGFINKFEGDAALAVFGAPVELDDPAGAALCAGRTIMRRLKAEVQDCEAGVGIAYGRAVAGNVGAHERFEYTVIGDPVNEGARLSDYSKKVTEHVVASATAVQNANKAEAKHWEVIDSVVLRGRSAETEVAVPR
ncbi:HAMP domain-containing protein [Hoyosella rhizosphaerae]|nr:adenylate/guanylate cyclase domain-containing protein [Hoyosella rhizosphaerae]MBN4927381.1 HAMP domain-containing protein [Hoyosella rhizosphaerae]